MPIDLPLHANEGVHQVAVGSDAVFAVTTHGRCFAWGSRLHGRLGADKSECMELPEVPDGGVREVHGIGFAVHVVCGAEHSLALNSDGNVFSWGSALAGRLGIGARAACLPCRAGHLPYTRMPEHIDVLQRRIVGLACSDLHCLALSAEGEVFAWGSASLGRLGLGREALSLVNGEATQPMPVKRLHGFYIVQVVCSKANSGCLSIAGDIFTWGATCYGLASCAGSGCAQEEPGLLLSASSDANRVTSLAMGKFHALALSVMALESRAAPFTAFYLLFLTRVR
jgi:alpha-tubulin suppressor-like RCC1 family protein